MQASQDDLRQMRILVQKLGWQSFLSNLAGLMAEQADKMDCDSTQSRALFNVSVMFQKLNEIFKDLGFFKYPKSLVGDIGVDDEEFPFGTTT